MNTSLSFKTIAVGQLTGYQMERMFELMNSGYDSMLQEVFDRDLAKKQFVGLILDEMEAIQGFTTFAINPGGSGTEDYHVLFSGDTILAHEHWGSQVMMRGWCTSVGSIIASDPDKKWYWYLLSKGHRTYMYLPLFFDQYYPNADHPDENLLLKEMASNISWKIFGSNWKPGEGVIRFEQSLGELKPEWAAATFQKKGSRYAQFFLERNPHFYRGEELVCLAPIYPENMKRSAKDYLLTGMQDAVHFKEQTL